MTTTKAPTGTLIVVSNRLPFSVKRASARRWAVEPGSGGLVTAMLPVLRDRGGTWIGWPGAAEFPAPARAAMSAAAA